MNASSSTDALLSVGLCDAGAQLFVSDLHLSPARPRLTRLFLDFLSERAVHAGRLFILGDLFDVWVGDDDGALPEVRSALRWLVSKGTDCWLMHGNRDFLIGRRFAQATGCRLLPDPYRLQIDGEPVLLMHGDLLCTDDVDYQRFRRRVRNPLVQKLFLWTPLSRRRRIAADYRQRSALAMAEKSTQIMDVNEAAVEAAMRRHRVGRLIHGHTHRPADHRFKCDGRTVHRHVLADWHDDHGEVLICHQGSWSREPWR